MIFVAVVGPNGTAVEKGLLDSGADDTVFPDIVASDIGIDLSQAPTGGAAGVGSTAAVAALCGGCAAHQRRQRTSWPARVGFTSAPLHRPLLGFAGFLQFFTATFDGVRELVELTVNSSYPGK